MKLVVFSEAGFEVGFGHFYRMSGVCEYAIAHHGDACLVLVADKAAEENLDRPYVQFRDWHDQSCYKALLNKETTLVVDSYHVSLSELDQFGKLVRNLIVIDDNIRLDYHDTIVINPNYYAISLDYPKNRNNTLYVGGDYTLLRGEFELDGERTVSPEVTNVLVTMGGTDPKGITDMVISAVKKCAPHTSIHVVCTQAYHNLAEIEESLCAKDELHLNIDAKEVSRLMCTCDFAIASAGQTTNELIKMQCPALLVAVADNQLQNTLYLSQQGYIEAIFCDTGLTENDQETICSMFSFDKRAALVDKMKEFRSKKTGKDLIYSLAFGGNHG